MGAKPARPTISMSKELEKVLNRTKVRINAKVTVREVWELECLSPDNRGYDRKRYRTAFSYIKGWTWMDPNWVRAK